MVGTRQAFEGSSACRHATFPWLLDMVHRVVVGCDGVRIEDREIKRVDDNW